MSMHLTGYYPDWFPKEKRWTHAVTARFFTTDFKKGVGEVLTKKIDEWLPPANIKDREKNNAGVYDKYWIKHESGKVSTVDIMTYEQQAGLAEGWSGHLAWYDECPPQAHRVATLRGLTDFYGHELFTATPVTEPYLYDEIYASRDPDVESFTMDIRHNKLRVNPLIGLQVGLTERAIRRYERSITDPGEFEARIHGKFKYLTGRIWKTWGRDVHTFDRKVWTVEKGSIVEGQPPRRWPRIFLIDPHDERPHALLWVAFEPEYEIFYVYREALMRNTSFPEVVNYVAKVESGAREAVNLRIMDPNFGPKMQATNRTTVRDDFEQTARLQNYPMKFVFGDDAKERGRKKVDELLWYDSTMPISIINKPRLFVANDLVNTIYMIEHYVWDKPKNIQDRDPREEPKKKNTDFPDLLHYLALSNYRGQPPEVIAGYGSLYAT